MATYLIFTALLLTTFEGIVGTVDQHTVRPVKSFKAKGLCDMNPFLCVPTPPTGAKVQGNTKKLCSNNSDCQKNEYCHQFHRICLPTITVTKSPVALPRSAVKCSQQSDCKAKEYCHFMWKICLPQHDVTPTSITTLPSWYCHTSKDCNIGQECHMMFHTCYNRPPISAVRRSDSNSRSCRNEKDCGTGFYCHDHFKLCLELTNELIFKDQPVKKEKKNKCSSNSDCGEGMKCHKRWKICYNAPPPVQQVPERDNKYQHGCKLDSDCRRDEFCHQSTDMLFRHRREISPKVCLPLSLRPSIIEPVENVSCQTDAKCGPNSCCLKKLGRCLGYQLPGTICLLEKTDFTCGCSRGSFCMDRGKMASPKRIINKLKLPKSIAEHILTSHKKKYQVGKCLPGSG